MTREEFFNKLKAGAKWDVGVSIARTNPLPLDANEIFESVSLMETYIKSNALAYPGQIVVVLGETETAAYLVQTVGGEGKGYIKLAATTGTGDVGEELTKLATRVTTVESYFVSGVAKSATEAERDASGNIIATTYATKEELTKAITGSVQYLDTVATDVAVSALKPNSKGDFARASANFTLSAANSATASAVSVHAGDLLICASVGTPNTWTISHGGEEGVVSISNGTGIAINNDNPANPTISLTTDYVNEIAKISNKVDQVNGKGLSTNDYTTAEKNKLADLTKITVDSDLTATGTNPVQGKAIYDTIASLEAIVNEKANERDLMAGLAIKLDAADYIVDTDLSNTSTNPVQNKVIQAAIDNLNQAISEKADDADTTTALNKKVDKTAGTTFEMDESQSLIRLSSPSSLDSASQDYQFNFKGITFNTDSDGETNVTINSATNTVTGGIKTGFTTSAAAKQYAVELNANGQAYVSVPWFNSTYSIATDTVAGLVKPISVITKPTINTATTTAGKYYHVQMSSDGNMFVNVPWTNTTYSAATTTALGLVKIGSGISVATDGTISLTDKTKYDGYADSISTLGDSINGLSSSKLNASALKVSATDGVTLNDITYKYTLPKATADALGGIRTGYAASGKNYAVQLDTNSKAYVSVPWTDTVTTVDVHTFGTTTEDKGFTIKTTTDDSTTAYYLLFKDGLIAEDLPSEEYESGLSLRLAPASATQVGGIKVGYDGTAADTYGVELDANGKAYVTVPAGNNLKYYDNLNHAHDIPNDHPLAFGSADGSIDWVNKGLTEDNYYYFSAEANIQQLSTDKLVNGDKILVLNGGGADD